MAGCARSLATKQTYGAKSGTKSENEDGQGSLERRDSRHRNIVESDKSRNPSVKVSNKFSPGVSKNSGLKNFRAYRACRDATLPPERRWDQKAKILRQPREREIAACRSPSEVAGLKTAIDEIRHGLSGVSKNRQDKRCAYYSAQDDHFKNPSEAYSKPETRNGLDDKRSCRQLSIFFLCDALLATLGHENHSKV